MPDIYTPEFPDALRRLMQRHRFETKSQDAFDADELYQQTIDLLGHLLDSYAKGDAGPIAQARESLLLSDKQSVIDAVIILQRLALQHKELAIKYKLEDGAKEVTKTVTPEELAIIKNYMQRLPDQPVGDDD